MPLMLVSSEFAPRAARDENVAMNLDDFVGRQLSTFRFRPQMKIINILGHEQKFVCIRR